MGVATHQRKVYVPHLHTISLPTTPSLDRLSLPRTRRPLQPRRPLDQHRPPFAARGCRYLQLHPRLLPQRRPLHSDLVSRSTDWDEPEPQRRWTAGQEASSGLTPEYCTYRAFIFSLTTT